MIRNRSFAIVLAGVLTAATPSFATNGDNLIGIGPISRALGGTGIAAPQDAISAVFANPAAMCFTPGCAFSEVNLAITAFMPDISAEADLGPMGNYKADSKSKVYPIPAIGISMPLDKETRRWRLGLSAYGVSGLGVDYRGTSLDGTLQTPLPPPMDRVPKIEGVLTDLMIMKLAPSLAWQATPNFSLGAAVHVDYARLDLRNGTKDAWGAGFQFGALYKPTTDLALGLTVITPQSTKFDGVVNYFGTGRDLELESPTTIGAGVGYTTMDGRLLLTVDGKWLNWSSTDGYGDFDWKDQWVVGAGIQYEAIPDKLFLRLGYNFGSNPLKGNNGWGGGSRNVQGMDFPDYYYESFRLIGFPAIVEHHLTAGIGYAFSEKFEINLAYVHAFEATMSESGSFGGMVPAKLSSSLSEDTIDLGLTWRF